MLIALHSYRSSRESLTDTLRVRIVTSMDDCARCGMKMPDAAFLRHNCAGIDEHSQNLDDPDFCVCGVAGLWETPDLWVCQRSTETIWLHPNSGLTHPPQHSGTTPYGFMSGH